MAWQSDERTICQPNLDNYSTDDREREDNDQTQSPFSSEQPPVRLQMNAKRTPYTVAGTAKGLDLDALKKPWRRAGADISDYFNYGFDEESWNAYCKKQTKLHAANIELCTKIRAAHPSQLPGQYDSISHLLPLSTPPNISLPAAAHGSEAGEAGRKSTASTDATEGRSRSSRRVEGWQCLTDKGNSTQVITEMSAQEDRITSYHLTPPSNVYTHPPSFPYRREPNHPSPSTALDSGHAKRFKGSSASQYPLPSGLSSLIPRTTVSKACASYAWQKKCDTGRGRSRERGHDKTSKRGRNRETESYSSRNRGEKRTRHRHTAEREHRAPHNVETDSGEKEWHRQRRHVSEGQQTSACSSSSSSRRGRKDDGEDRKSQNRRKHKKTKKNAKDKETSKMLCTDNEENQI